jgi:hypothetical protein
VHATAPVVVVSCDAGRAIHVRYNDDDEASCLVAAADRPPRGGNSTAAPIGPSVAIGPTRYEMHLRYDVLFVSTATPLMFIYKERNR